MADVPRRCTAEVHTTSVSESILEKNKEYSTKGKED